MFMLWLKLHVPEPVRLAMCGLPPPLSKLERFAVRFPLAEGVNVTVIEQLAPGATLLPQVLIWAKSPASAPATEILVILTATLPLLLSVIFLGMLLVPTGWLPNFKLAGVSCT
jgi:hypothetical protein